MTRFLSQHMTHEIFTASPSLLNAWLGLLAHHTPSSTTSTRLVTLLSNHELNVRLTASSYTSVLIYAIKALHAPLITLLEHPDPDMKLSDHLNLKRNRNTCISLASAYRTALLTTVSSPSHTTSSTSATSASSSSSSRSSSSSTTITEHSTAVRQTLVLLYSTPAIYSIVFKANYISSQRSRNKQDSFALSDSTVAFAARHRDAELLNLIRAKEAQDGLNHAHKEGGAIVGYIERHWQDRRGGVPVESEVVEYLMGFLERGERKRVELMMAKGDSKRGKRV
jgi:hypothetical protein